MSKRIVIIGGGFAGLKLARKLQNSSYEILLIDRLNFHQFQPLFYQVAAARLDASNISFPLRKVFHRKKNVFLRITEVQEIMPSQKKIITGIGEFDYDYLVIATGADTNYFGNLNIQAHTLPMKSMLEALNIRMTVLQNFENMYTATTEDSREGLLNYVIVGGGPTGVELAGAMAEMKKFVLPKDYNDVDFTPMNIYLLEAGPELLAAMSERSSATSRRYLERMGVSVLLNTAVKDYDGKTVVLGDGKTIRSNTVIWAAGVKGNVPAGIDPSLVVRGNRILVDEFNRVKGFDDIFAIGDIAAMVSEQYPSGHPQLANVAQEQAANVGRNLKRKLSGNGPSPFVYKSKGSMATVGRSKAVVDLPGFHFSGILAWAVWMFLHLLLIMGMKNRIQVFINWASAYFTKNSSLRIILKPYTKTPSK